MMNTIKIMLLLLSVAALQAKDPAQYNYREKMVAELVRKMPQERGKYNDTTRKKFTADIISFGHEALPVLIDSWESSFSEPKQQAVFNAIYDVDVIDTNIYSLILNKFKTSNDANKAYLAASIDALIMRNLLSSSSHYINKNKGYLPLELMDSIIANTSNESEKFNIEWSEISTLSNPTSLSLIRIKFGQSLDKVSDKEILKVYPGKKVYLTTGDYARCISMSLLGRAIEYTPENQIYSDENAKKSNPTFTSAQFIGWYKKYRSKLVWVGEDCRFMIDEQYKKILEERNMPNDN